MLRVIMTYNPYKVETKIIVDQRDLMEETKFARFKHERLQVWVDHLFYYLEEILNEDYYELVFKGLMADFEDIIHVGEAYTNNNHNVTIQLDYIPVEETNDKFAELANLVEMMQNGPFESLRDPKVGESFQRALNSEFEIAVIATMSSGKSTLINALLGRDLMPSKNEACTAKISKIKNVPNLEGFSAIAYDHDLQPFKSINNATMDDFEVFNDDRDIALVEIEGTIPEISSGNMNLVLVDTPGPNNSMDGSHREHTLSVIKSADKPMVLYVLNATQLRTDDDYALLRIVADAMAVGGKQSKDRFIFAVNKADTFDPERGESLQLALENVREYLEQQGIENPNIYPISAQTAKVIRKNWNGYDLSRQEKRSLDGMDLFLEEETMQLQNYAPLSYTLKSRVDDQVKRAQAQGNRELEALYYTGVPSIEAAINEYLEKYAVTSKVTNAVNTFKGIVDREQYMQQLQYDLATKEDQRQQVQEAMEHIEEQLAQGVKAKQFKQKIEQMEFHVDDYFDDLNEKIFGERINRLQEKLRGERMKKAQADVLLYKMQKDVLMIQDDAVTDLENIIRHSLREKAEQYLQEYHEYIAGILDFEMGQITIADWDKAITADTPDIDNLIDDFTYTEREVVGTDVRQNTSKKWYKPWTWGESSTYEVNVYGDVDYVDLEQVRDYFLAPVIDSLRSNFKNATKFMQAELLRLQQYFIAEIERLEDMMKERVAHIKMLAKDSSLLEQELEEKRNQKIWLDNFIRRLDDILELHEAKGVHV